MMPGIRSAKHLASEMLPAHLAHREVVQPASAPMVPEVVGRDVAVQDFAAVLCLPQRNGNIKHHLQAGRTGFQGSVKVESELSQS